MGLISIIPCLLRNMINKLPHNVENYRKKKKVHKITNFGSKKEWRVVWTLLPHPNLWLMSFLQMTNWSYRKQSTGLVLVNEAEVKYEITTILARGLPMT